MWVRFSITDIHVMVLKGGDLCDKRRRGFYALVMDVNEFKYIYVCTVNPYDTWKLKNALVKSVHCPR